MKCNAADCTSFSLSLSLQTSSEYKAIIYDRFDKSLYTISKHRPAINIKAKHATYNKILTTST